MCLEEVGRRAGKWQERDRDEAHYQGSGSYSGATEDSRRGLGSDLELKGRFGLRVVWEVQQKAGTLLSALCNNLPNQTMKEKKSPREPSPFPPRAMQECGLAHIVPSCQVSMEVTPQFKPRGALSPNPNPSANSTSPSEEEQRQGEMIHKPSPNPEVLLSPFAGA